MAHVPTTDDVLAALPMCESPAATVVRAARLYLGVETGRRLPVRGVAAAVGVPRSTVAHWLRRLGLARTKSEAAALRERRVSGRTARAEAAVCRAYLDGDPVGAIRESHGVSLCGLYGILGRAGVPLRGPGSPGTPTDRMRTGHDRRRRARALAAELGVGRGDREGKREIARQLGVSERSVRAYLRSSPPRPAKSLRR